jgi:acyl carrier protein
MEHMETVEVIRKFLVDDGLEGSAANLTADTPLREWGVLGSMSTIRLVSFIAKRFEITAPNEEIVGQNFKDINSIAALIAKVAADSATEGPGADSGVVPAGRPA